MNVQPDLAVGIATSHGQELQASAARHHAGRLVRVARRGGFKVGPNRYRRGHRSFEPVGPTLAPAG